MGKDNELALALKPGVKRDTPNVLDNHTSILDNTSDAALKVRKSKVEKSDGITELSVSLESGRPRQENLLLNIQEEQRRQTAQSGRAVDYSINSEVQQPQPEKFDLNKFDGKINKLVEANWRGTFTPDSALKQVEKDLQSIFKQHGGQLSKDQRKQVAERYQQIRNQYRTRMMLQEVEQFAGRRAAQDFRDSPANRLDSRAALGDLRKIAGKYSDVENLDRLESRIRNQYRQSYEVKHSRLFSRLSWVRRKYYGLRRYVSGAWRAVKGFATGIGNFGLSLCQAINTGCDRVVGTVVAVGKGAALAARDLVKPVAKAAVSVVKKAASGIKYVVTHPVECLKAVKSAVDWAGGKLVEGVQYVWEHRSQIGSAVMKAAKFITYPIMHPIKSLKAIKNAVDWVGGKVVDGIQYAWEHRGQIGAALMKAAKVITYPIMHPIKSLKAIKGAIDWAGGKLVEGISYVWKHRGQIGSALKTAALSVGKFCVDVVTNPREALRTLVKGAQAIKKGAIWLANTGAGKFVKNLCHDLGLTDLAVGLYNLVKAPVVFLKESAKTAFYLGRDIGLVLSGELKPDQLAERLRKNIGETFKKTAGCYAKAARCIKGAVLLAGEITGITDVVLCVKYALKGDWMMAGLHAGFAALSIGSIVATVATAGAAAGSIGAVMAGRATFKTAAKEILEKVAKECLEKGTKQVGSEVVEKLMKELSPEMIQQLGRDISGSSIKQLAEVVQKEGVQALQKETTQKVCRNNAEELVEKALKEADFEGIVEEFTEKFLKSDMSQKELYQQLRGMGYKRGKAKRLSKRVARGDTDRVAKKMLEDDITKQTKEYLEENMEAAFKDRFEKSLRNELGEVGEGVSKSLKESSETLNDALRQQAKRTAKETGQQVDEVYEKLVKEHVDAGWKGVREGIEKAVRKLAKRAIARCFKRFRSRARVRMRNNKKSARVGDVEGDFISLENEVIKLPEEVNLNEVAREAADLSKGRKVVLNEIDGLQYQDFYVQDVNGLWTKISSKVVGEANKASKATAKKASKAA